MTEIDSLSQTPQIAHVLFLDLVGFSRETMQEQGRLVERLNATVTGTRAYTEALSRHSIIEVPSGDGMALLFFDDVTAPARCAVEISRASLVPGTRAPLALRMGVHSGLVQRQRDISGKVNVVGDGINTARRVMDFGGDGDILLSDRYAAYLGQIEEWTPRLFNLGEAVAKHEQRVGLFALRGDGFGRADPPAVMHSSAEETSAAGAIESDAIPGGQAASGLEPVGGAVPPGSRFYVERACDSQLLSALDAGESILLIKGPRQVGKTSLMARGIQRAHSTNRRVLLTDFQKLGTAQMASDETLYRLLAATFARQMKFAYDFENEWDPIFGANLNLEGFLRALLESKPEPLIWCMDEADRLFTAPFASDFFGLVRSWHNARSTEPGGPWAKLTVVIAYATEAHLFIQDVNQSPFNVGRRLDLEDFTVAQTLDLSERCGNALGSPSEAEELHGLIGGQPFLTRRALDVIATAAWTFPDLIDEAGRDDGPFGDHLKRILVSVTQLPAIAAYVSRVLAGGVTTAASSRADLDSYYRLLASGVLRQDRDGSVRLRCDLYRRYLAAHMETAAAAGY